MNGLIQKLLDENKNKLLLLLQDIQKLLKTRAERCAPVITHFTEYSVISFQYLAHCKNDIKIVEFNELYIPYLVQIVLYYVPPLENE